MSVQSNFRAQDMLGTAPQAVKKAAAPRIAPVLPKVEPAPVVAPTAENLVVEPEATSTEE
jgi:hypothetical protein